jgi:hypothetical protein
LHLYNEPTAAFAENQAEEVVDEHNKDEFEKGAAVLGFYLGLTAPPRPSTRRTRNRSFPEMLRLELQPLASREKVVNKVMEMIFSPDADPIVPTPQPVTRPTVKTATSHGTDTGRA